MDSKPELDLFAGIVMVAGPILFIRFSALQQQPSSSGCHPTTHGYCRAASK
jgi:hypothetical protein